MIELLHGDCLERLRELPDCSVDACVTDPPYGLSFMGKTWDYDVPPSEVWREVLRVLKPGGHLLAFAGTRTQHRMAVRIEDAGFEIRDMIAWIYGTGFPKSLDVSKAIDRMDASEEQERRRLRVTAWVRGTGATSRQIDDATSTNMGGHYTTAASQPAIMTREHLEQCRHLLGDVPEWIEREADIRSVESRNMAEREVVDRREMRNTKEVRISCAASAAGYDSAARAVVPITAPATPEAQQWAGWGTALKPALEPITVARKPLAGTVAENVLAHGTGGINVDGCRVEHVTVDGGSLATNPHLRESINGGNGGHIIAHEKERRVVTPHAAGRWPANLIHDGSDEVVGLFPLQAGAAAPVHRRNGDKFRSSYGEFKGNIDENGSSFYGDTGSAARFFYCAKASKADREDGNIHPTVKPTDLMRYLCRLVTPPGGVVLDPFMGSGSTGKAAVLEGFRFIGIEREAEYLEIARRRIQLPKQVQGSLL